MAAHPLLRGGDVDFKISESHGTPNESCKVESGFDTLSVRVVEELVTLGPRARGKAIAANTAPHLAPAEFHDELVAAQGKAPGGAVLLDVRNVYESRIGRFEVVRALFVADSLGCLCFTYHTHLQATILTSVLGVKLHRFGACALVASVIMPRSLP